MPVVGGISIGTEPVGAFIHAKAFGCAGDGAKDDTAALQSAIYAARGSTLYIPAGKYMISAPLIVRNRTTIIGDGPNGTGDAVGYGTEIHAKSTFSGTYLLKGATSVATDSDFGGYMHWTKVSDLIFYCGKADGVTAGGVLIDNPGESFLFERVEVKDCGATGIRVIGVQAVSTFVDCAVWGCTDYGLKMTGGGSGRFFGLSGDGNRPAHIYTDSGMFQFYGLKSEGRANVADPGCVVIGGSGTGGARAQITFFGGRADSSGTGGVGGGSFVTIQDTARPTVSIFGFQIAGFTNALNNTSDTDTIAATGASIDYLVYGADGSATAHHYMRGGSTFRGKVTVKPIIAGTGVDIVHDSGTTDWLVTQRIGNSGDVWQLLAESGNKQVLGLSPDAVTGAYRLSAGIATGKPTLFRPARLTLTNTPTAAAATEGALVYVTNGRKPGEGAGSGTGVLCYSDAGAWISVHSGVAVTT